MSLPHSIGRATEAHHAFPDEVRGLFVLRASYTIDPGDGGRPVVCEEELGGVYPTAAQANREAHRLAHRSALGRLWDRFWQRPAVPLGADVSVYRSKEGCPTAHGYELVGTVPAAA